MINTAFPKSLLIILLFVPLCFAQSPASAKSAASAASATTNYTNARFMPLTEVKEGMRGTALTVFNGSVPEEFSVEILGIVPGAIGPRQDMIVGRLSGANAERTAVFAGMSGSPVYIDGKLVGAISYSFPFAKEPICGITPIEQMVSMFETKTPAALNAAEPRALSFTELAEVQLDTQFPGDVRAGLVSGMNSTSPLMAVAGQSFQRIATPVAFTGFSQRTLNVFSPQLAQAGLMPVSAVGGSAPITKLKEATAETLTAGRSVTMQLTRGDYSIAAAGTVTLRDGAKIYAFGHPFLSLGTSELPMSESHVVTVIPNMNNSFKLAVPDAMVGSMTLDLATGVFGKLGQAPKMIPVTVEIESSRGLRETLSFEVARDDFLTPLLLNMTMYNSAVAHERSLGNLTVELTGEIQIRDRDTVKIDRRFTGGQASQLAAASVAMPVQALLRGGFEDLEISGLSLKLRSRDGFRSAAIERLSIDKDTAEAGETVNLQVFARTNTGKTVVENIAFTIPEDTAPGTLSVTVADGSKLEARSSTKYFVPENADNLIDTLNEIRTSDRLYLQAYRTAAGAVIGTNEMPNLPPSVLATLNSSRTSGGINPAVQSVVFEKQLAPAEFLVTGEKTITINVVQ